MLTVACVLRSGGKYDGRHVERLMHQVEGWISIPHRFVCLSDVAVFCDRIPLIMNWPGWWSKIELFRPGLFDDRVLYLDLDVKVVGPLDDLALFPGSFCVIRDYQYPLQINSSVMAWDAGAADHLFTDFKPAVMNRLHGDQNWIHERQHCERFTRAWCPSYKVHVRPAGKVEPEARVIVFHGHPKPWDLEEESWQKRSMC